MVCSLEVFKTAPATPGGLQSLGLLELMLQSLCAQWAIAPGALASQGPPGCPPSALRRLRPRGVGSGKAATRRRKRTLGRKRRLYGAPLRLEPSGSCSRLPAHSIRARVRAECSCGLERTSSRGRAGPARCAVRTARLHLQLWLFFKKAHR